MATFLYKLGRLAFRRRHFAALIWVALLTLAGVGAASAPVAGSSSFWAYLWRFRLPYQISVRGN